MVKEKVCKIIGYMHLRKKYKLAKVSFLSNVSKDVVLGKYAKIYPNVTICNSSIGDFTYICHGTAIGNTKVGKFCSIGSGVKCGMGIHPSRDFISTHPIFYSKKRQTNIIICNKNYFQEYNEVEIGNDVWIGLNAIILDGVKIGTGAIIGAGAVVTKDVPPYAIVVGVPAKIIRYRFTPKEISKLLNEIKWWDKDLEWLIKNCEKMHNIKNINELI